MSFLLSPETSCQFRQSHFVVWISARDAGWLPTPASQRTNYIPERFSLAHKLHKWSLKGSFMQGKVTLAKVSNGMDRKDGLPDDWEVNPRKTLGNRDSGAGKIEVYFDILPALLLYFFTHSWYPNEIIDKNLVSTNHIQDVVLDATCESEGV